MCGIFGCFASPAQLPSAVHAAAALGMLRHRGPDAEHLLHRPEVGLVLGHVRLSILDLGQRAEQPFTAAGCVLVFNGEIYNFRELRAELAAHGHSFTTTSDTEVIAVGYRHWGQTVFDRLRGMFAIALWDELERCLHLVRDEFGIKPLCLLQRGDQVVFASEVKAIAALQPLGIDGGVLCDVLTWGFPMADASLYEGVRFLPPGTQLTLRRGDDGVLRQTSRTVWQTKSAYREPGAEPTASELRAVIEASVADHMIADVPVAVALSGGLDSSIVTVGAARHQPLLHAHTFTLAPLGTSDPEVVHASLLAQQLGIAHHIARLVPGDLDAWLRRIAWHLEEPIANPNSLPGFALGAVLRRHDCKVVLVGEGSDELFGGYPWYRLALDPVSGSDAGAVFDGWHKRRAQSGLRTCLRPATREVGKQRLAAQRLAFGQRARELGGMSLNAFASFDLETQLQYSQLLRVDRMFMVHGVEARVPFLYRSVLQASAALPARRKLRLLAAGGGEKIALREAFASQLPPAIVERPKFGEQGTVDLWSTWLGQGIDRVFARCVLGDELRAARQRLDEFIDWSAVARAQLSTKERFAVALLLECVDGLLVRRAGPPSARPIEWESS